MLFLDLLPLSTRNFLQGLHKICKLRKPVLITRNSFHLLIKFPGRFCANLWKKNNTVNSDFNLAHFIDWLAQQIKSGNKRFALGANDLIIYSRKDTTQILFLLPEVLENYFNYSGVYPDVIHKKLRQKLDITHLYTVERHGKIIEVTPMTLDINEVQLGS